MEPLALTLLLNCDLYSPSHKVIGGGVIIGIQTLASQSSDVSYPIFQQVIDMQGSTVIPGFVDMHVHVTGGGGEKGPASRVPEAQLSHLVTNGVTTVVGVLGTDGVSRSLENLLFKVQALNAEGITAYMYTGNYRVPVVTLTGSVQRDITLIEPIIGVGEIALSDHRGSHPSRADLAELASDARVAGLLSGKAGIVHVHMGDADSRLGPLWDVILNTPIPITQRFVPTHMGRNPELAREGIDWVDHGGYVDFTADEGAIIADYIVEYLNKAKEEVKSRITVSSDSYGSLPKFDEHGRVVGYCYGTPDSLLALLKLLIERNVPLPDAVAFFTENPATILKLKGKGKLEVGWDADILVLDPKWNITYVIAKGQVVKSPDFVKKAMFE